MIAKPATEFTYPTQDDVRLNPVPDAGKPWWERVEGETPQPPKTESWRKYSPDAQLKEYEFLLRDVLKVDSLEGKVKGYDSTSGNFAEINRFAGMATAMHDVSHDGDRDPVRMRIVSNEEGQRHIETFLPPSISGSDGGVGLHQRFSEEGWAGMSGDHKYGGLDLPHAFSGAISEMMMSANPGYTVLEMLSSGVAKAIEAKGSDELKAQWLPRINSGKFTGAMVMTEPNYGSSLIDMETTVQLDADGKAGKVYGYKRFLSSADHNATIGKNGERNIVHMVLARTADADGNLLKDDKGRAKLSLVLVPRVLLDKDGNYVDENGNRVDKPDTNHVRAAKLNDKMGLEVQSNTDAAYDGSKGFIVGEVGDGLKNMFVIMNEARMAVGLQGVGIAELVRQNMERYVAEERKQGVGGQLVNYPDIQDKILTMRAHIDAGRSIAAEVGMAFDQTMHADTDSMTTRQKADLQRYVDVMTPLVKWGLTEKCDRAIDQGLQAMGGAGYMREWGIAQAYIDSRIARIYEGSNPVLAMGVATFQLKNMDAFLNKIRRDMTTLNADGDMADITTPLNTAINTFQSATDWMQVTGLRAKSGDEVAIQEFQAAASHYMELMYEVAAGTALAKNACVAKQKLRESATLPAEDKAFYENKIATARYYSNAVIAPEHAMHYAKMTLNARYLELPDREIERTEPTLMQQGAKTATLALVKATRLVSGFWQGENGRDGQCR
jgi:alkylation response protein AidB-like acyl-CoA dehydrogenase